MKTVDDREAPPTELITIGSKLMYTEQWLTQQKKGGDGSSNLSKEHRHWILCQQNLRHWIPNVARLGNTGDVK